MTIDRLREEYQIVVDNTGELYELLFMFDKESKKIEVPLEGGGTTTCVPFISPRHRTIPDGPEMDNKALANKFSATWINTHHSIKAFIEVLKEVDDLSLRAKIDKFLGKEETLIFVGLRNYYAHYGQVSPTYLGGNIPVVLKTDLPKLLKLRKGKANDALKAFFEKENMLEFKTIFETIFGLHDLMFRDFKLYDDLLPDKNIKA